MVQGRAHGGVIFGTIANIVLSFFFIVCLAIIRQLDLISI